jgi:hypothetical protein
MFFFYKSSKLENKEIRHRFNSQRYTLVNYYKIKVHIIIQQTGIYRKNENLGVSLPNFIQMLQKLPDEFKY